MKIIEKETLKKEYQINIWSDTKVEEFQEKLLSWYDQHRRDLPWRKDQNPYRIWVSEIMLQQTRVETVIPYFNNFMKKFPTVNDLAHAPEDEVLKAWEGLGYYSRARNLHTAAKQVVFEFGGKFPDTYDELIKLKGIGPYTAGAIASMAFNEKVPAVDGNVMRVVSRLFEIDLDIKRAKNFKVFFSVAYHLMDEKRPGDFNQAMMDLGSMIMTPKASRPDLSPVKEFDASYLNETWEKYPVVTKAKAARVINMWGIALKNTRGEYLLEKRPNKGLLANLWTFPLVPESQLQKSEDGKTQKSFQNNLKPTSEELDKLTKAFKNKYGLQITIIPTVHYEIGHVFSHRIWNITELEASTNEDDTPPNCEWVKEEDFENYTFPTVQQKMVEQIMSDSQTVLF